MSYEKQYRSEENNRNLSRSEAGQLGGLASARGRRRKKQDDDYHQSHSTNGHYDYDEKEDDAGKYRGSSGNDSQFRRSHDDIYGQQNDGRQRGGSASSRRNQDEGYYQENRGFNNDCNEEDDSRHRSVSARNQGRQSRNQDDDYRPQARRNSPRDYDDQENDNGRMSHSEGSRMGEPANGRSRHSRSFDDNYYQEKRSYDNDYEEEGDGRRRGSSASSCGNPQHYAAENDDDYDDEEDGRRHSSSGSNRSHSIRENDDRNTMSRREATQTRKKEDPNTFMREDKRGSRSKRNKSE